MRSHLIVAVLALSGGHGLLAQDRPAQVVTASTVRYPEILRVAGIAGLVEAAVIVLPGDTLASDGIRVITTPHPGFRNAMIEGLRQWKYRAAIRGGSAVADTIRVALMFDPGTGGTLTFGPMEVRELRPRGEGIWQGVVSPNILRGKGSALQGARRDSAGIVAVRFLVQRAGSTAGGGARIVCVTMHAERGADPLTAAELDALQMPGAAVVDPRRCPPTFNSMAYMVGRVIPPGGDPYRLVVREAREFPAGWIGIKVESPFGNGQNDYECLLPATPIGPVTDCLLTRSAVY